MSLPAEVSRGRWTVLHYARTHLGWGLLRLELADGLILEIRPLAGPQVRQPRADNDNERTP